MRVAVVWILILSATVAWVSAPPASAVLNGKDCLPEKFYEESAHIGFVGSVDSAESGSYSFTVKETLFGDHRDRAVVKVIDGGGGPPLVTGTKYVILGWEAADSEIHISGCPALTLDHFSDGDLAELRGQSPGCQETELTHPKEGEVAVVGRIDRTVNSVRAIIEKSSREELAGQQISIASVEDGSDVGIYPAALIAHRDMRFGYVGALKDGKTRPLQACDLLAPAAVQQFISVQDADGSFLKWAFRGALIVAITAIAVVLVRWRS